MGTECPVKIILCRAHRLQPAHGNDAMPGANAGGKSSCVANSCSSAKVMPASRVIAPVSDQFDDAIQSLFKGGAPVPHSEGHVASTPYAISAIGGCSPRRVADQGAVPDDRQSSRHADDVPN